MKHFSRIFLLFVFCVLVSCADESKKEEVKETTSKQKKEPKKNPLNPFVSIELKDLSAFKPTGKNWIVVGDVITDRTKKKSINSESGTGILLNTNDQKQNKNLFTTFQHKDIELELDVMMPVGSNSGIYFQSRYEVQLYDSWNVKKPKYLDMGAIYQRWDKTAPKGQQGYEGHPPRVNAAKAPGLWQHLKVIFHAPKFDKQGNKIKNAWFEEVWLNGVLVHQNVEVTGPTRGPFNDEKAIAPLMIQGDHGPVALKNIQYRLYEGNKIKVSQLVRKEFNEQKEIGDVSKLTPKSETETTVFSLVDVASQVSPKMVTYEGILEVPVDGKYAFEIRPGKGNVELHLEGQKVHKLKSTQVYRRKVFNLKKGTIKFQLIYNHIQGRKRWLNNFSWFVEGEQMKKYALQDGEDVNAEKFDPLKGIIIEPEQTVRTQRSFIAHKGETRTHCISAGTPEGTHYSYDLATGTLLRVWNGSFLNTTHMWLSRGYKQQGEPVGFSVELHGDLEFADLENEQAAWPKPLKENKGVKQLGYTFDKHRIPTFTYQIDGAKISNTFYTHPKKREVKKVIKVHSKKNLWHKIAEGEDIKSLSNNTFIINNESFYIDFSENKTLQPVVRTHNGVQELLVKIPSGTHKVSYKIIW